MLSRIAIRNAATFKLLLKPEGNGRVLAALVIRNSGGGHGHGDVSKFVPAHPAPPQPPITEMIKNWDKANDLYYGKDRDYVNYPKYKQPVYPPATRLGFIPDTWFRFFYDKTGVTGPYALGVGFLTFVFSKEIWIMEHKFFEFLAFWSLMFLIIKKYGPSIAGYLDKMGDDLMEAKWLKPMETMKSSTKAAIADLEKTAWREEGQRNIFDVKRENVELQLETVYRSHLAEIYGSVKKRLDYQLEVENTTRKFQQQHMATWIIDNVIKSITPQQEKEALAHCIQDLKRLSQTQAKSAMA